MRFTEFASTSGLTLTPAQRVAAIVAFEGIQPRDLSEADRAIARQLLGDDVDIIPPTALYVVAIVKGARIGGSRIFAALRSLHAALTMPLHTLAPGEQAFALIVAPDMRLAGQVLRYALGAAKSIPAVAAMIVNERADAFTMRRPDGALVTIECLPATAGGSAVRGRSLVCAVMSEACFFRDASAVINDLEVYRALVPRLLPGAQLILESTPWAQLGLLHALWDQIWNRPRTALAIHAPTLLMRTDARTRAIVDAAREVDPENAKREFDALWLSNAASSMFDPATVDAAQAVDGVADGHGIVYSAGGDLALRSDSAALAIVATRDDRHEVVEVVEMRPEKGKPLTPSGIMSRFAEVLGRYQIAHFTADSWEIERFREAAAVHDISVRVGPGGAEGKAETYAALAVMLGEGRIKLPDHKRLAAQLKSIIRRPRAGGGVSIEAPRRKGGEAGGGHGDIVSALVLAAWVARDSENGDGAGCAYSARPSRWAPGAGDRFDGRPVHEIDWYEPDFQQRRHSVLSGSSAGGVRRW